LDMLEAEKKLILQVISVGGVSGFFDWVSWDTTMEEKQKLIERE
jgi:hypothetical protein